MKIITPAGNMLNMLRMIGATGGAGASTLFSPAIASMEDGLLKSDGTTQETTAFMIAEFQWNDWKVDGDVEEFVLDCEVIAEWIKKLYSGEEKVVFDFGEAVLAMKGEKDTATVVLDDLETIKDQKKPQKVKVNDDFLPVFKGVKPGELKKVTLDISELRKLVDKASLVYTDTDHYALKFSKKGSVAHLGSITGKDPGIISILDATVKKGNDFEIKVGANFKEIVSSLEGEVELFAHSPDFPLWIRQMTKEYKVGFMIAPVVDNS